jgi:uncharacterized protein YkwD
MILLGGFTGTQFSGLSESYSPNLFAQPFRAMVVLAFVYFLSTAAWSQSKATHSRAIPSAALTSNALPAKTDLPSKDEQRLLELVNQERETAGLKPLTWDKGLADAARAHSKLLAQHKGLSHQFMGEPDLTKRAAAAGVAFTSVGENVGYAPDVDVAHNGFMNSPPHRENILRPDFNAVGIAIVPRGDELYITQDFSRKIETVSNDQFDRRLIAAFNQLRNQKGLEPMSVRTDARLQKLACTANLNAQKILGGIPGATDLAVFTTAQPDKLPVTMQRAAADKTLHRMDVGVCFKPGGAGGFSTYWVVAAFFPVSN